jgi:hypothetical protein
MGLLSFWIGGEYTYGALDDSELGYYYKDFSADEVRILLAYIFQNYIVSIYKLNSYILLRFESF